MKSCPSSPKKTIGKRRSARLAHKFIEFEALEVSQPTSSPTCSKEEDTDGLLPYARRMHQRDIAAGEPCFENIFQTRTAVAVSEPSTREHSKTSMFRALYETEPTPTCQHPFPGVKVDFERVWMPTTHISVVKGAYDWMDGEIRKSKAGETDLHKVWWRGFYDGLHVQRRDCAKGWCQVIVDYVNREDRD